MASRLTKLPNCLDNLLVIYYKFGEIHFVVQSDPLEDANQKHPAIYYMVKKKQTLFYLRMPLEHVDFHIIGFWMSSIWPM